MYYFSYILIVFVLLGGEQTTSEFVSGNYYGSSMVMSLGIVFNLVVLLITMDFIRNRTKQKYATKS